MKVPQSELQAYFASPLPDWETLVEAFTFHAFEIEGIERIGLENKDAQHVLDIKVLPNRAADCNSVAGIALELSAILDLPLAHEPVLSYPDAATAVTLADINGILGSDFSAAEVEDVFRRLRFKVGGKGDTYHVTAPAPRNDIAVIEDVAEEVGQILGYDHIPSVELPFVFGNPDQALYHGIERIKDSLVKRGFTEVSTQSFAKHGEIKLANPLDKSKPALRKYLTENLGIARQLAFRNAALTLGPKVPIRLFEIGKVFPGRDEETLNLAITSDSEKDVMEARIWMEKHLHLSLSENISSDRAKGYGEWILQPKELKKLGEAPLHLPVEQELGRYKPFSVYPFVVRDIACWVSADTSNKSFLQEAVDDSYMIYRIESLIKEEAGSLLARLDQFDRFEKEGKISLAFRLVFQSMDRTLTDDEVNKIMEKITVVLTANGYEVR